MGRKEEIELGKNIGLEVLLYLEGKDIKEEVLEHLKGIKFREYLSPYAAEEINYN